MNRKDFIVNSCMACLGTATLSGLISSCSTMQYVSGSLGKDGLFVDVSDFALKEQGKFRSYIVVRNESLLFPICVYRFSANEFTALWMRCAHQGAELNVSGDVLQCPAHGSEFSNRGKVTSGPADQDLRIFPVTVSNNQLFIDLRKV